MKSIKKKIKDDYPKSNILEEELSRVGYRVGFEKGANYVLECFESILPFVAKKGIIYGKIKETIEQLKK